MRDNPPAGSRVPATPPPGTIGKLRTLDDGCIGCNSSKVACDAAVYVSKQRCCGFCDGHGGLA